MKTEINNKIKEILEEDVESSSKPLEVTEADKIRFINDVRSRSVAEGKSEDFQKTCDCDPRTLSSDKLDSKYKSVQKWAVENLDNKNGIFKNDKMEKTIIKEADDRIKQGFNTLVLAKKSLEEAQSQLTMNLGYHFMELNNAELTVINEGIETARKGLEQLAVKIRRQLKV